MQSLINDKRGSLDQHHLSFVGESPICYHCHHFNLFFDQTIDDALGVREGTALRTQAAHDAAYQYLSELVASLPRTTPSEQLDIASSVFAAMGHGRLNLQIPLNGGRVSAQHLHYGHAWQEKYGGELKRETPTDAFAAGFAAAASEIAYKLPAGSRSCREDECIATNHSACSMSVTAATKTFVPTGATFSSSRRTLRPASQGASEETIEAIAAGLRNFLADVEGDKRGLVDAFGVLVTMHLPNYYNHCANRALNLVGARKPEVVPAFRSLLAESGQVCAFHTFGGILASPEWEALVGPISGDSEELLIGGLAIARALGFGRWAAESYEPARHLVLTSSGTYESMYPEPLIGGRGVGDANAEGTCLLFEGGALGLMQLMHRVDWSSSPTFDPSLYAQLQVDIPWRAHETHCTSKGDDVCRVVVEPT